MDKRALFPGQYTLFTKGIINLLNTVVIHLNQAILTDTKLARWHSTPVPEGVQRPSVPPCRDMPVGDMVNGQLHCLPLAAEQDTRIAHIGCQQLGSTTLAKDQGHCRCGATLGPSNAALAHPPKEAALWLEQLLVCLVLFQSIPAQPSSEAPGCPCCMHVIITSHAPPFKSDSPSCNCNVVQEDMFHTPTYPSTHNTARDQD